jgi:branched-chain amino acid transport system substrate-binding protein
MAACGSSKSSSGSNTTAAAGGPTTTAAAVTTTAGGATTTVASGGPTTSVKTPTSEAEWEALWQTQRDAIVKRITDNKWGLSADGKTITGPEGFTIDVTKCAAGWNNMEGLTDTDIKIGQAIAQSGTLAAYGQIAIGLQAHFDVLNKAGGIKDSTGKSRKITYIAKDDGYDAARTVPLVDELIDSEKVFLVWTLGSPNTLATYDKLNQRCIPQPFAMTGHPAWGDPVNHPWTTGAQMAYNFETTVWGNFIEQHKDELKGSDGKITVAGLVINNDFGAAYDNTLKAWIAKSDLKDQINYVTEKIEATAPTITDAMTTLAAKKPAVFIAETAGVTCTQAVVEAAQDGLKDSAKYLFQPSVCKSNSFLGKDKVGGDGSAANGWWVVGGDAKDISSPAYDNDPWAQAMRAELTAANVDWKKQTLTLTGEAYAWPMEQVLRIASALPGGLTRANFIVAIRSMDMTSPVLIGGQFAMDGDKDAYFTETTDIAKYDSAKQSFVQQGDLINLPGTPNCHWDQKTNTCT